jgi:hypothetical protein
MASSSAGLAFGAETEELQSVGDFAESVLAGDAFFEVGRYAIIDLKDLRTTPAYQVMMMMAPRLIFGDLESGTAIPQIDALNQAQLFEARHRPVNRGKIATIRCERFGNFLRRPGPLIFAENLENHLAWTRNPASSLSHALLPILLLNANLRSPLRSGFH